MRLNIANESWLSGMIDFIFPPLCLGCCNYSEDNYSICNDCRNLFDKPSNPFCLNYLNEISLGLIVDDVVTTGQTVYEARKVLNQAGHKVVGVVSIAHAL